MDFTLPAIIVATLATTCLLLIITFIYNLVFHKGSTQKPPEAGGAWPIIGHLHLLAAPRPTFKILADMADKYGPIFRIRLGTQQVLVVSDSRIAKECFTTNDRALAGRPKALASEIIGYNYAMFGLCPYGDYWRHVRKVVVLQLLSNRRREALMQVWDSGVRSFAQEIYRSWASKMFGPTLNLDNVVKLDMKEMFGELLMDVTMQTLFGQQYEEEGSRTVVRTASRLFNLLGVPVVGDYLPWLRWVDIGGHEKTLKETAKKMDSIVEGWLQEHKRKRNTKSKEEEDFMDGLINSFHGDDGDHKDDIPKDFDADTIVKSTCMGMLFAGTDTTTIALTWALSLILNNSSVLEKIRAELDVHVGRERHVNQFDLNNLIYLQAVVKETLRLYTPGPLLLPHECIDDCVVNGYNIQKGTRLLVNVSMIHRDPDFWSDPDVFRPERFLNECKDIDVRGNHFELIPFGSGRRVCPAISLALQVMELVLACLIHDFDLKRISDEPIDMKEMVGMTNKKATPLHVFLTPRLPSHLYLK
ncbi:cytochrome P450 CYP82D47-like [Ipomoea triloba]|uniref:cytochrome P450 CYP82D47-like n=1 Tax=Ipomoea triloba TaxID=35885 RepID=UPI00125D5FB1|nr:cytochrome P450 CYP82D47-like [Ipomoea triloba]